MAVPLIHESDAEELDLPGRRLRWVIAGDKVPAEHCSACVIRVAPGERLRPAAAAKPPVTGAQLGCS